MLIKKNDRFILYKYNDSQIKFIFSWDYAN